MNTGQQTPRRGGNKAKVLLIVLVGVLVLIIGVMAFCLVSSRMKNKNYNEAITSAEKYLSENNYEDAVVEYKKAISVNPKDAEAYLGLAEVYLCMGDVDKVKAILDKGYLKTKSPKIQWMLRDVEREIWVGNYLTDDKRNPQDYDLDTASEDIKWDSSFFQKLINYTFEDYKREFGNVSISKNSDGFFEVKHSKLNGICYYRNKDENRGIVDESRKTPEETGMPEKVSLNSLGLLFRGFDGVVSLEKIQMLVSQRVRPKNGDGSTYIEAKLDNCIIRIETDSAGNIVKPDAWNEIILVNANKEKNTAGHIAGTVVDAVTGNGVANAKVEFKSTGSSGTSAAVTTDQRGMFEIDLEPDNYKVVVTADYYIEEVFACEVEEGKTYSGLQYVISPDLEKGTARIVLEWNSQPQDLDSYLFGETDKGDNVLVKFSHKEAKANGRLIASLDIDDVDGYGPETTTIYDLNGVYRFVVADFNRTRKMKECGATVKVYLPGKEPVVITIDSGADVKDIWNVCEIDHGELKITNDAPAEDQFSPANK